MRHFLTSLAVPNPVERLVRFCLFYDFFLAIRFSQMGNSVGNNPSTCKCNGEESQKKSSCNSIACKDDMKGKQAQSKYNNC